MHRRAFVALGVVLIGGTAANLQAAMMDFTITADNHYAIYNAVPSMDVTTALQFVGMNETGPYGDPGDYNWSLPEHWQFENLTGKVYVAAWSDDSIAQALLAQVYADATSLHTGNAAWEVYPTGLDLDDFDVRPTEAQMASYITTADTGSLWETPYVGGSNGVGPWFLVPGITEDASWTWWDRPGDPDPLDGGTGDGEFIIFRLTIPTPGSIALAGVGAAFLARRRRS
ncbi:MAG TPA: PEP-CTERM sorting domain-containing protein [Phycisphaerales bacterium]|nr:PEP-CTERM sorting domain-containing protein [Phycisphaerales bacterium]